MDVESTKQFCPPTKPFMLQQHHHLHPVTSLVLQKVLRDSMVLGWKQPDKTGGAGNYRDLLNWPWSDRDAGAARKMEEANIMA